MTMTMIKLTHSISVDSAEVPDVSDLAADLSRIVREAVDAALRERGFHDSTWIHHGPETLQ